MQQHESSQVPEETVGHVVVESGKHHHTKVPRTDAVHRTWLRLHLAYGARPAIGAVVVGGAALVLAAQIGALELAVGALTAYTAYRMLRYGIDLKEALTETIEVEQLARNEV
ncbi:MAG: hypothetical protein KF773_11310 [Deltaproteobacteria bacterium]|nr:hypothetical protein [Deltaproteobacteria bacterium]MCW5808293.1 hypothetical protein [Deltaproteobacteria bacterium]